MSRSLVTVFAIVTDYEDRFVSGLKKEHFEIIEDKIKQEIVFFSEEDAPASIGLIFDVSGSMKEKIARARTAIQGFMEASHPDDEFFAIAFNDHVELVQDFTTSLETILNRLSLIEPQKRTALYDAVYLGIEKVLQGRHQRKALLIVSDGQDNFSRYTFGDVRRLLRETDVQIYAIGIIGDFERGERESEIGCSILRDLTQLTGGLAFFPDTQREVEAAFTRIALDLRRFYSLGFYPTNPSTAGKWRKIRVKVKPPKGYPPLSVRARLGYLDRGWQNY